MNFIINFIFHNTSLDILHLKSIGQEKCYFHICTRNVSGAPHLYLYNKALVCNVGCVYFLFDFFLFRVITKNRCKANPHPHRPVNPARGDCPRNPQRTVGPSRSVNCFAITVVLYRRSNTRDNTFPKYSMIRQTILDYHFFTLIKLSAISYYYTLDLVLVGIHFNIELVKDLYPVLHIVLARGS